MENLAIGSDTRRKSAGNAESCRIGNGMGLRPAATSGRISPKLRLPLATTAPAQSPVVTATTVGPRIQWRARKSLEH